jgi:hypothetical protein
MTRFPQLAALSRDLARFLAHRRGELRRLDLLAHGIDLDLDRDQLVELGQAPDHEDILAKLQVPDKYLKPIWAEHHCTRPIGPGGMPAAIASRGQGPGQAVIDAARREADRVRALLVELARVKITGQVDELAASLPPYEPGSLDWHIALDELVDRVLPPDPGQNQDPANNPAPGTAPEESVRTAPEDFGFGEADSTSAGQGHSQSRARSGNRPGQSSRTGPGKNRRLARFLRDETDDDWTQF